MDGFAVGALGGEAGDAGVCEPDGVFGDGFEVEVFGFGVEEGDCGDVDAGVEWAGAVQGLVEGGSGSAFEGVAVLGLGVD